MRGTPGRELLRWLFSRQASVIFLSCAVLAVLVLSLIPHPEEVLGKLSLFDKADHLAAYVVLSFFAARAIDRRSVPATLLAVSSCAALGGLIEIIQPLVGRNRELADFLVDLCGSMAGAVIAFCFMRKGRLPSGRWSTRHASRGGATRSVPH
jgi:VanZ family protein